MRNSNILLSVALIASSAKASLRHQGFVHPSEAPFGPLQTDFSRVNSCSSPRLDCVPIQHGHRGEKQEEPIKCLNARALYHRHEPQSLPLRQLEQRAQRELCFKTSPALRGSTRQSQVLPAPKSTAAGAWEPKPSQRVSAFDRPIVAVCFDFDQTLSQAHIHRLVQSSHDGTQGEPPILPCTCTSARALVWAASPEPRPFVSDLCLHGRTLSRGGLRRSIRRQGAYRQAASLPQPFAIDTSGPEHRFSRKQGGDPSGSHLPCDSHAVRQRAFSLTLRFTEGRHWRRLG